MGNSRVWHKNQERERKKVIGVKLKVYFIHVPPLHDRDTEMNIKTSKNDVFGYWNQLHVLFKDDEADIACPARERFFSNTFNLLKNETIPNFIQ